MFDTTNGYNVYRREWRTEPKGNRITIVKYLSLEMKNHQGKQLKKDLMISLKKDLGQLLLKGIVVLVLL